MTMRCLIIVTLVALSMLSGAQAMEAGASIVDITPPLGSPLSGYGDRMGRGATEVHDPLTARCLYLNDQDTQLFLVTTDLCIINRELRDAVVATMPTVVSPENLILTATHNHNGTGGMVPNLLFRTISGPYRQDLIDFTAYQIVAAMEVAYEKRTRATIAYGTTKQEVLTVNRQNSEGPRDTQIGVIKVENADGAPIAIIGNMAAHPTTVPEADRFAISADYPGYFYTELERLAGEGCVAMFLNGAEGNQRCANPEGHSDPWLRMESIGRLLAIRVKGVANRLTGDELPIDVRSATVKLPPTLANRLVPKDVFLQTLQIGDLLMTFFPGEPCVEIGLEMRKRALAAGYEKHFTVGLANDHLLYFVPASLYATDYYESGMSLFGPEIEDWFYDHFTTLMDSEASLVETASGLPRPMDGDIISIELSGPPRDWGKTRAEAIGQERIHQAFERHIAAKVRDRSLIADVPYMDTFPSFIDVSPVTLPLIAIGIRAQLALMPESTRAELAGFANAANVPFDTAYLLQLAPSFAAMGGPGSGLSLPFCTMVAVPGDDGITIARTFDWTIDETMTVARYTPDEGQPFITIGPSWSLGAFSGMNASGVVTIAERVEGFGAPKGGSLPIEFLLRTILTTADSVESARALLAETELPSGYAIIIVDSVKAVALRPGSPMPEEIMETSTLLAVRPGMSGITSDRAQRYAALNSRLSVLAGTTPEDLADAFAQPPILNDDTRFLAVFKPSDRGVHIFAPDENGSWSTPERYTLPRRNP